MLLPPSRFLLLSFRFSSSARWLSRCRAAVAVAELFAAAAAGDTVALLLLSSLILPSAACAGPFLLRCLLPDCFALYSALFPLLS